MSNTNSHTMMECKLLANVRKKESSMVDDAEESASKNPEGGVLDDHLKPIVNVEKKRK